MKKLLVLVALMLAGVWFWRSPHAAVERLREATRTGDSTQLGELIDFESVRANLKTDLRAAISNRTGVEDSSPVGALGAALGGLLMDPLIDAFVSPEGLAAVAHGRMPDDDDADATNIHIDRRSVSVFVARFEDADRNSPALEFNLDGGRWRLVRIVIPVERT